MFKTKMHGLSSRRALFTLLLLASVCSWSYAEARHKKYYAGSIASSTAGRNGLRNPERGLRTEAIIAEPRGSKQFVLPAAHVRNRLALGYQPQYWTLMFDRLANDGITVAQTYCYLTDYLDCAIPDEKIKMLEDEFEIMRRIGVKCLLRFAYEKNMSRTKGPTKQRILQHIAQLGPVVKRNKDVVYAIQAGFIGAWGEWHSAANVNLNKARAKAEVLKAELVAFPRDRQITIRTPILKRQAISILAGRAYRGVNARNAFSLVPEARVGYANDGVLAGKTHGGTFPYPPYGVPGGAMFDLMTRESAYVVVDGELFWGMPKSWGGGPVTDTADGLKVAEYLAMHHFTTFSLAHSYSEREGLPMFIDGWRKQEITPDDLRKRNLPFSEFWFKDIYKKTAKRTAYEYIRDHLGYRLELVSANVPQDLKKDESFRITLNIKNYGFSTLINPRPVYITLTDVNDNVYCFKTKADPRKWQPYDPADKERKTLVHTITFEGPLPKELKPGTYGLGLWMPDAADNLRKDPRYAVRLANPTLWWKSTKNEYGINNFCWMRILPESSVQGGSK